jgi:hypothetical protein
MDWRGFDWLSPSHYMAFLKNSNIQYSRMIISTAAFWISERILVVYGGRMMSGKDSRGMKINHSVKPAYVAHVPVQVMGGSGPKTRNHHDGIF